MIIPFCLILYPEINDDFNFIDRIGTGSQATVDLYKKKVKPT